MNNSSETNTNLYMPDDGTYALSNSFTLIDKYRITHLIVYIIPRKNTALRPFGPYKMSQA